MKKSILALFALVALSTTAYAQEDQGSRSLSVYLCGNSGILNQASSLDDDGDAVGTFVGNWTEFGLVYDHGFENGFGFDVSVVGAGSVAVGSEKSSDDSHSPVLNDYSIDTVYAKLGISYGIAGFSTYLSLETTVLTAFGVGYGVGLGAAGSLSVGSDVCFYLVSGGYDYEEGSYSAHSTLDFFQVYLGYSVGFAEKWGFGTKAMFRFVDGSDADAFVDSFRIRWDNTISYAALDNLSFYGRVRYQAFDVALKDADIDHQVSLQGGLTYSFDF